MSSSSRYAHFQRYEWILFYSVTILNIIPAIRQPFFPSIDGPTHLYNAKLISILTTGQSVFLESYYAFTDWVVPNWGGHAILAALLSAFSPEIASRLFIGLFLFLFPVSFRFLIRGIRTDASFSSYLIFPFSYSFLLCMGFYNFLIGLVVLFTAIGLYIRYVLGPFRWSYFFLLVCMTSLCYLCHLFSFLCFGLTVFCFFIIDFFQIYVSKRNMISWLKSLITIAIAFILPLILTVIYYSHNPDSGENVYILKRELATWVFTGRNLVWYLPDMELGYSSLIAIVILFIFCMAFYCFCQNFSVKDKAQKNRLSVLVQKLAYHDAILAVLGLLLILYFMLPDSDSFAGFVSIRLNLMIFLFMILWLSASRFSIWIKTTSLCLIFYAHYSLLKLHESTAESINKLTAEIKTVESFVKPNTVILPLNYSENWVESHLSNYLGVYKPVVILENHETNNSYFPLRWACDEKKQELAHSDFSKFDKILNDTNPTDLLSLDYVFVLNKHAFSDSLWKSLPPYFQLRCETQNCLLFENTSSQSIKKQAVNTARSL